MKVHSATSCREAERLPRTEILILVLLHGLLPSNCNFRKEIACVCFDVCVFSWL